MTGIYVINIGAASAKGWVQFSFEKTLNGMSTCQIGLDGISSVYQAEFVVNNEINIYKAGTLKFRGIIVAQDAMVAGGIILTAQGIEIELTDNKSPMTGTETTRVWTTTSDNTILSTLVTAASGWTVNTTNSTSGNVDFRTSATESIWNATIRLVKLTGKDIKIDQTNKIVYFYDELTRADKFSFVEGKNAYGITRKTFRSKAGKVLVYGKGDGENQIIGSTGTGTPVYSVIDRNIITTTEADARAVIEYARLNPETKSYNFVPSTGNNLEIGDRGDIINNSAGINESVDIVRIKTLVDKNGTEKIDMEVTNPTYRIASKNLAEDKANNTADMDQSLTAMQGSGNVQVWGYGINAKLGASAKIEFNVSPELVQDDAGNLRVNSLTIDYDVDPFNQQFGVAAYDGTDPQVQNISDTTTPSVTGTSSSTDVFVSEGASSSSSTLSVGFNNNLRSINVNGEYEYVLVEYNVSTNFSPGSIGHLWVEFDGTGFTRTGAAHFINGTHNDIQASLWVPVHASVNASLTMDIYTDTSGSFNYGLTLYGHKIGHDHADGTYAAANHSHNDGTYDINAADIDDISIGDDVGEAASTNATEVDIFLDYWSGAAWVNKTSVINTGTTLDTDVDLTSSGTYPDVAGLWRIRIEPNSASADFVQGVVKLKHNLDS